MALPRSYRKPPTRRLRVYAFDPQSSTRPETAGFNHATISLPWEEDWEDQLTEGPVNEYLEVIDVDPASGQFYHPVDLNHPHILAQDGLAPAEGDPCFHQQMVFAVAMKTIKTFERALGRKVFWSPVWTESKGAGSYKPVRRLRIYPHALREPNAYYSRAKKALLFGYFRGVARQAGASWIFTALSHDIIVHETTHAILDGLHRRYAEPTSVDSLAFHEAFADIVALLSHFTLEEALKAHIAAHGGNLNERSLMSGLARQFGDAIGRNAALREGIDKKEITGLPDPGQLESLSEAHARGAVLVAAIFDAFLTIYAKRTADLMRIAGVSIEPGVTKELSSELTARLAREATKSAEHVLRMCIRALDYLPPVDVRFGEFLRAIITADADLVADDRLQYRLAMVEAFRRRGILPEGCLSLAPDSLLWEAPMRPLDTGNLVETGANWLDLEPKFKRDEALRVSEKNRLAMHKWLLESQGHPEDIKWEDALGVYFMRERPGRTLRLHTVSHWADSRHHPDYPAVEVHSVRTTRRAGPDGQDVRQLVIEVTQRRRGFLNPETQAAQERVATKSQARDPDFIFRGGATVIIDLRSGELRYVIRKRIDDDLRLEQQRSFLRDHQWNALGFAYRDDGAARFNDEPFALLHRGI